MTPTQEHFREDRSALEAELKLAGGEIRGNTVKCPFHEDGRASGSLYEKDGVWRYKCNAASCGAGGDVFDIRARISGRSLADVLREREADPDQKNSQPRQTTKTPRVFQTLADLRLAVERMGPIEGEYSYDEPETGVTDLLVFRYRTDKGKQFVQCHPAPGGWVMQAPPKPWPLCSRAALRAATDVLLVEGEKCVEALQGVGLVATTSPGGAAKPSVRTPVPWQARMSTSGRTWTRWGSSTAGSGSESWPSWSRHRLLLPGLNRTSWT